MDIGYTDKDYVFEFVSFDQYSNLAEVIKKIVGIKVNYKGGNEYKTKSIINPEIE